MVCFIHHTLFDDSKATMMGHDKFWTLFYSVQNNTAVEIIREAKTLLGLCVMAGDRSRVDNEMRGPPNRKNMLYLACEF